MDAGEAKALADIERYGCHVLHVLAEGDSPPFSYSIGVERTSGAPELLVIGLKQPLAHSIINEYNRRVRAGERFGVGNTGTGFIEGFEVKFGEVHRSHYRDYLGWAIWLYGGTAFRILQLLYPTVDVIWPWDAAADDWFRRREPVLAQPAPAVSC